MQSAEGSDTSSSLGGDDSSSSFEPEEIHVDTGTRRRSIRESNPPMAFQAGTASGDPVKDALIARGKPTTARYYAPVRANKSVVALDPDEIRFKDSSGTHGMSPSEVQQYRQMTAGCPKLVGVGAVLQVVQTPHAGNELRVHFSGSFELPVDFEVLLCVQQAWFIGCVGFDAKKRYTNFKYSWETPAGLEVFVRDGSPLNYVNEHPVLYATKDPARYRELENDPELVQVSYDAFETGRTTTWVCMSWKPPTTRIPDISGCKVTLRWETMPPLKRIASLQQEVPNLNGDHINFLLAVEISAMYDELTDVNATLSLWGLFLPVDSYLWRDVVSTIVPGDQWQPAFGAYGRSPGCNW